MADKEVPQGRLGRFVRLATMGARTSAGLLWNVQGSAQQTAEVLGNLRGLAAKIGQMASYVDGVVPEAQREAYESALSKLRSQAPRSSLAQVRALLVAELGGNLEQHFARFDDDPIASASIGQVHAAWLHDGTKVAVKVQHPGIDKAVESDLANASMLESVLGALGGNRFDSKTLLAVVRERFREELDYTLEAERAKGFANEHRGDPRVIIPRVFETHSTKRVLTVEFVDGKRFEEACLASESERRAWAETLWRFTFKSMMGGALLHADPHPGNYVFQEHGRVVFLDYGCVQGLGSEHRARAILVHRLALANEDEAFESASKALLGTRPGQLEQPSVDYMRHCLQPLFHTPYRITRSYAAQLVSEMKALALAVRKVPADQVMTMPPHMLFVNRLQFGLYSVLARLDVAADYAGVERTIFKELSTQGRLPELTASA